MKTRLAIMTATVVLLAAAAHGQGSLTPPGAPAPTMKSLSQVEPRTPIASGTFSITVPGSYYLTTNIVVTNGADGIDIFTNGVTIDLNGFTIISTSATDLGFGILLANTNGNSDITIINGHIRGGVTNSGSTFSGPGFLGGITYTNVTPQNVHVSGVTVSGCFYYGIDLSFSTPTVVESCTANNCGYVGIYADVVSHCSVYQGGSYGIVGASVSDCTCEVAGTGNALYAYDMASSCTGYCLTGGIGIRALIANGCYSSSGDGYITHPYNMP